MNMCHIRAHPLNVCINIRVYIYVYISMFSLPLKIYDSLRFFSLHNYSNKIKSCFKSFETVQSFRIIKYVCAFFFQKYASIHIPTISNLNNFPLSRFEIYFSFSFFTDITRRSGITLIATDDYASARQR